MTKTEAIRLVDRGLAVVLRQRPLRVAFVRTGAAVSWPDDGFSEGEADAVGRVMAGGL